MKKRAIIGLVAVLAAMGLAVGGCGSDDETTALTKAQFTKQVNALCKKSGEERVAQYRARQAAEQGTKKGGGEKAREELFRQSFVIPFQEMVEEIEELGAPEGDEEELEAIYEEWLRGAEIFEQDPLLLLSEPPTFDKANKLSAEYGLTDCQL